MVVDVERSFWKKKNRIIVMTPSMTRTQVTNYSHHGASIIMTTVNLGADNVLLAVAETRRS